LLSSKYVLLKNTPKAAPPGPLFFPKLLLKNQVVPGPLPKKPYSELSCAGGAGKSSFVHASFTPDG
jgi:hypothetical protein